MPATVRIASCSKFNVRIDAAGKASRTLDGVTYDSVAERSYAAELTLHQKTGRIRGWERQVRVPLLVYDHVNEVDVKVGVIVPDFLVTYNDGTIEYIEVKGHETALWKLKYKLFKALHPLTRYRIVKV